MFCLFYVAVLGLMYLPPFLGAGKTNVLGVVMGLSDTTSAIYSGIAAAFIG
jgi:hypothetical protein